MQVESLDGPGAVRLGEVPEPEAGPDMLLVDVHTSTVVYPDLLQTRGLYQYKPEPPFVPGSVVAGTIRADGSGFAAGQRVVAMTATNAWAEVAVVAPALTLPLPDDVDFAHGAALPFNYGTMYFGLKQRGGLRSGETVLVHGAAGGIGTAAVQLAKALGARVFAVVSTDAKGELARAAGADEVLAVDGFKDRALELTDGRGVDLVVDPVGGDRFTDSLRSLALDGRLLVLGFTGGDIPTVKVNRLLLNNISVVGVGWGAYWACRPEYLREEWDEILPLLSSFSPVIGATYPLADAAEALVAIEERRAVGNVILTIR